MFFRFPNHKKRPEPVTKAQKVRELELLKREQHKLLMLGYAVPLHLKHRMQKLAEDLSENRA